MFDHRGFLPRLASLRDYFDYFDGNAVRGADGLLERQLREFLLKTYMLETNAPDDQSPSIVDRLRSLGVELVQLDSRAWLLSDASVGGAAAVLESIDDRYHALYTQLSAEQSDRWARRLTTAGPGIDNVWLAAPFLEGLWSYVEGAYSANRFVRLAFEHEAIYEYAESDREDVGGRTFGEPHRRHDAARDDEHRSSRFTMVDRISVLRQALPALQRHYEPLEAVTQLRVPGVGRGGHDFYFDGKVTNRSDSFQDHRQTVAYVLRAYRTLTKTTERLLWYSYDVRSSTMAGQPVHMQFSRTLDGDVFNRWIAAITRKNSRFKVAGRTLRLGPGKVHIYGVDRHMWQPLQLELTRTHATLVLPFGTCGNTVHRLVTNVQRFVDPAVTVWFGSHSYSKLAAEAISHPES